MGPPAECWGGSGGVRGEKQGSCDSHGAGRQGELSMKRRDGQNRGTVYVGGRFMGVASCLESGGLYPVGSRESIQFIQG